MKFNKIMIILIVLLAVFMVGSVCADENVTDDSPSQSDADEAAEMQSIDVILFNETENDSSHGIADAINITFDEQMWQENLSDITVQLPDYANGTFCLKIGSLEVYNQTITNTTLTIPVRLPEPLFPYIIENIYPPRDCTNYKITAFYNGIDLNVNRTLSVMKNPPEYEYWWGISDEILQYDTQRLWNTLIFPRSANGIAEIYVDGELINKTSVKGPYLYYNLTKIVSLPLGNHTMKIIYYNDTYYCSANRTLSFKLVNVKIHVPTSIYIGHDDCITVDVLNNTSGRVNVYVDNSLVYTGKTDKRGEFLLSLERYVKYTNREVKVEFIGKDYSRTKTVPLSIRYDFGYYDAGSVFTYGDENIIELNLPDTLNNSRLSVTINGTPFTFTHPKNIMNNIVEIDISKLKVGNYTIVISYSGDDHFCERTETYNFTVVYSTSPSILLISSDAYTNGVNVKVKVIDSKGNPVENGTVTLKISGKKIKAKTNKNGIAKIKGKVNLKAGRQYYALLKYNSTEITKELAAKHVVHLKAVKVKKSDKKLVLTASLKQKNKALKSKTVTFKFNGKTYKAKTNKKGIAKAVVKSSDLNRLKAGKTVKYQATYLKDTVKKSAKVRR